MSAGCSKSKPEYVEVQETENNPPAGTAHPLMDASQSVTANHEASLIPFTYTIPVGWSEMEGSTMVLLRMSAGKPPEMVADFTVSAFPGDVGGQLANINRWRRQVGLGPVSPDAFKAFVKDVKVSGMDSWQVDFTGPDSGGESGGPARVLVTVVFTDGKSWFFKLTGNNSAVEQEQAAYTAFLNSVKF